MRTKRKPPEASFKETGNLSTIRELNRKAVLDRVRSMGATSRVNLVKELKLAPATITVVVNGLIDEGLIVEEKADISEASKRNRGRPKKTLRLNPSVAFSLGLSLRVEHNILLIDTSICDYANSVRFGPTLVCSDLSNFEQVYNVITKSIGELISLLPANANVIGLGIGIPGVVNQESVRYSPNIPCIEGSELHKRLVDYVSMPIYFENDVNLLVIRELEKKPSLKNANFSYLLISQGVGAGTALYGELWQSSGWAGEIGHIKVPFGDESPRDLEWLIGLDGYFAEKMAGQGIIIDAGGVLPPDTLKDNAVKEIFNAYTSYLSLAVQMLNCTFDLDVIIIGTSNESILNHCMPTLLEMAKNPPLEVDIVYTPKGQNAAAEGAALLAGGLSAFNKAVMAV